VFQHDSVMLYSWRYGGGLWCRRQW